MVDSKPSAYAFTFERKVTEIFNFLEVDPKKSLKIVAKEIDTRGKKIMKSELLMLRVIKGVVLERNLRVSEASDEIFGVLDEIEKEKILDHFLLDTLSRSVSRMIHKDAYMARYQTIIENLVNEYPKDKELVYSVYEGSLKNNKFSQAAKMAAKMVNTFDEPSFALNQV
jgi:hypothetical protein